MVAAEFPRQRYKDSSEQYTGSFILPIVALDTWIPSKTTINFLNALNRPTKEAEHYRKSIEDHLMHNMDWIYPPIAHKRSRSAFITHDPARQILIVEFGLVEPQTHIGHKHEVLNTIYDYAEREKQGMEISSGHLAELPQAGYLFIFDKIGYSHIQVKRASALGETINTLHAHDIIPLNARGYVQLPAFV